MFIAKNPFAILFSKDDFDSGVKKLFNDFFKKRLFDKNAVLCDYIEQTNPQDISDSLFKADCERDFLFINIVIKLKEESIETAVKTIDTVYEYFHAIKRLNSRFRIYSLFEEPNTREEKQELKNRLLYLEKLKDNRVSDIFLLSKTPYKDGNSANPLRDMTLDGIIRLICYSILATDLYRARIPNNNAGSFSSIGLRKVSAVEKLFKFSAAAVLLRESAEIPGEISYNVNDIITTVSRYMNEAAERIMEQKALFALMLDNTGFAHNSDDLNGVITFFFDDRIDKYYKFNVTDYLSVTMSSLEKKAADKLTGQLSAAFEDGGHDFFDALKRLSFLERRLNGVLTDYEEKLRDSEKLFSEIRPDKLREESCYKEIQDFLPYNCAKKYIELKKQQDSLKIICGILNRLLGICKDSLNLANQAVSNANRVLESFRCDIPVLNGIYYEYFRNYKQNNINELKRSFYARWVSLREGKAITEGEIAQYINILTLEPERVRFMAEKAILTENAISSESDVNLKFTRSDRNHEKLLFGISPSGDFRNAITTIHDEAAENLYILRYDASFATEHIVSVWE